MKFIVLIGLTRVYFGVHSFNQVLLGWVYGMLLTVSYFAFREHIYKVILEKIQKKLFMNDFKRRIAFLVGALILFLWLTLLIFTLRYEITVFPEEWYVRLKKKCSLTKSSHQIFLKESLLPTSMGFVIFGVFLGFIVKRGNVKSENYWKNFKKMKFWQGLLRVLAFAVVTGVILGIPFLIKDSEETSIYIILLFKNYLPCFTYGLALIALIPFLYQKLEIDIEGDLLRVDTPVKIKPEGEGEVK